MKATKYAVGGTIVGATSTGLAALGLSTIGFTTSGVAAGSIAAGAQAAVGNVVAGSLFATLQGVGATAALTTLPVVVGVAGVGAVVGLGIYAIKPKL